MTKTVREQRRLQFLQLLEEHGLTREQAAELVHSSLSAVAAWCKPETSKSSNPVPMWAIELLQYKMADRKKARK